MNGKWARPGKGSQKTQHGQAHIIVLRGPVERHQLIKPAMHIGAENRQTKLRAVAFPVIRKAIGSEGKGHTFT